MDPGGDGDDDSKRADTHGDMAAPLPRRGGIPLHHFVQLTPISLPPTTPRENKNDEWFDLTNTGTATVDMTGWVLKDESSTHRYRFPNGFNLEAGSEVRVIVRRLRPG